MSDDRSPLSRILDTTDEPTFFRDYWGQKALLIQDGDRSRFDGLFGLDDLEAYLFIARPEAGDVQLVRQGQWPPVHMVKGLFPRTYDVQGAYAGLMAGYTIVLNAIHFRWPAARKLVAELEDRLLATVQTNVYVTGPNAQGFAIHHDDHDVLVLQTHGAKRWQIYDKARPGAVAGAEPTLLHDVELTRGDVLYMPKGFPHAAATSGDFSIHVTVGIFPMTWHELARQTLDRVAQQDPRWADAVPMPTLSGAALPAVAEMEARLHDGLATLKDFSSIIDGYRSGLSISARRKNPAPGGYLHTITEIDRLDVNSEIARRSGVGCQVTSDAQSAQVHFMGETIHTPVKAAKALRFIAATPRFRIADIDDVLTDESKLVLIRRLIREGLLQLAR